MMILFQAHLRRERMFTCFSQTLARRKAIWQYSQSWRISFKKYNDRSIQHRASRFDTQFHQSNLRLICGG